MKYQKAIDRVKSGKMPRVEVVKLRRNAEQKLAEGDQDAEVVLAAIDNAKIVRSEEHTSELQSH